MYVKRDKERRIVAVSATSEPGFDEQLNPNDTELQTFIASIQGDGPEVIDQLQKLRSSDVELARVVEDIISLLTDKGIIQFTELPKAAQQKLLQRKSLREDIQHLDLISDDDNEQLMP